MIFRKTVLPALMASVLLCVLFVSCDKDKDKDPTPEPEKFNTVAEFYAANQVASETFTFDASAGGTFTTAKGTKLIVQPNAFVDANMNPVTGSVKVELKDLYSKSDILFSGKPTVTATGMLKSAGEFFILATKDNAPLLIADGKNIQIEQPAMGEPIDSNMRPFILRKGAGGGEATWVESESDTLDFQASSYLFSLYDFNMPASEGTWCNSDNSTYFSAYPNTVLTLTADGSQPITEYQTDVFLVFNDINSMIHVYQSGGVFPYNFAPVGLACTAVVVGVKDGKLYSAFLPLTITANLNTTFTMTETTGDAFKAALEALN